ncbi:hypothetical protein AB3Y40_17300 [Yoonia sp. R2331]|uniref:hypothetical protein n=1 Tax=Yoonia sp. R2331 TaxID=3237238 RepID=UPI0034E4707C
MQSTTLCDYQVLRDTPFTLDAESSPASERTFHFTMPPDLELGDGLRQPILSFAANVQKAASFRIFLNAREIITFNMGKAKTRSMLEPFNAQTAFPEGSSAPAQVPLRILMQRGKIGFQNLILFYQIRRDG